MLPERLEAGPFGSPFKFTGEMMDSNGLVYLRARYYHPGLGVFPSLDPVEGSAQQAMSLNRYGYVAGNVLNAVDPSGMLAENLGAWDPCRQGPPSLSCDAWLDNAYNVLRGRGHWSNQAANILENYRQGPGNWDCVENQPWNITNVIGFDNPSTGSVTPWYGRIYLNPSYLNINIHCPGSPTGYCSAFLRYVGVLSQELWHTKQANRDRYSVWGELEAFNLEIQVRGEIGAMPLLTPRDRNTILNLGNPGEDFTRNIYSLCEAKDALPDFWVYNTEPLVWVSNADLVRMLPGLGGTPDWALGLIPGATTNLPVPQQICSPYVNIADWIKEQLGI